MEAVLIWVLVALAVVEFAIICWWIINGRKQDNNYIELIKLSKRIEADKNLLFKFFYNCRMTGSVSDSVKAPTKKDYKHLILILQEKGLYAAIQATKKLREIG